MWRVSSRQELVPFPPGDFGHLESSRTYALLYASSTSSSSNDGSAVRFVAFVWHGSDAPQSDALAWAVSLKAALAGIVAPLLAKVARSVMPSAGASHQHHYHLLRASDYSVDKFLLAKLSSVLGLRPQP